MMMLTIEKKSVMSMAFVGSLLVLTGCMGDKKKSDDIQGGKAEIEVVAGNGDVLLTINGKPVLYSGDFEDQKAMALQSNQQMNMILQMMPETEYTLFFKSLEAGHLMKEWVVRHKIDQDPELAKQRRQYHDAIDLQLYMKYYEDKHPIHVSDHEAREFYTTKRSQIPALVTAPESVEIVYVNFDAKDKAEEFLAAVRDGSEKHFNTAAKLHHYKVTPLSISAESQVNDVLKNTVLTATKFPAKEIVKIDDNSYWVIGMQHKKDAEYRTFDTPEVKQGITQMCMNEKREGELAKQVDQLRKEFNAVENKSYFEKKNQNHARALQQADKIVAQAQQGLNMIDMSQDDDMDEELLLQDKI